MLEDLHRDHQCGELSANYIGTTVTLMGWAHRVRDLGGLIFIELRDRSGIVQISFDPQENPTTHDCAQQVRSEFVLAVQGVVQHRPEGTENPNLPTGAVEVRATRLEILNTSKPIPFSIADEDVNVDETTRLRYRFLDLRRAPMQRLLEMRHRTAYAVREFLTGEGFWEVETPLLMKSTPEGARDYLVPSRVNPGEFYALPQSPQLLKQILMVSGVEKYFQLARCLRDEDLRADRQPEHTQIDMEMSFVNREDIFDVAERMWQYVFKKVLGVDIAIPFTRLTYADAMARFGSDKPDLRYGLELVEISSLVAESGFKVFTGAVASGGQVKGINAKGAGSFSRKEVDELTLLVKEFGAKGLAYLYVDENGVRSPITKFFSEEQLASIVKAMDGKPGDLLLFVADQPSVVADSLGRLRIHLARRLDLIPKGEFRFLWVIDFPMFEYKPDEGRYDFMHNPMSAPNSEDLPLLAEGWKSTAAPSSAEHPWTRMRAEQYDLVLNGTEVASGSIRNYRTDIQEKVFEVLGISKEQAHKRFGFILDAFQYGAPPHGGIAPGLDRMVAIMGGADSIRDVIAFPKTASATDLMMDAPSEVDQKQLDELHIRVALPKKQ
ncbi:MAG TPA: aspartate--tRNA ligase [Armatimonadota bacterium]|nr:aspartate--tRNA ligase [Armatimonadota bacterium]